MSPLAFLARPARWLQTIHRHRGTISAAPNFAYELCTTKLTDADLERIVELLRNALAAAIWLVLTMLALARLALDNIANLQSSWVTMGPQIGQLALFFGANDMGSVMMEENVVSAAGTTYQLTEKEIRNAISQAGWIPRKRNFHYQLLEESN